MRTVAIIFGGRSNEHEISTVTGVTAYNVIDRSKFLPIAVYLSAEGSFYTVDQVGSVDCFSDRSKRKLTVWTDEGLFVRRKNKLSFLAKPDCVLNCCHGGIGEGGGIAALCELFSLPNASCGVLASAVGLKKSVSKLFAKALGLATLDYRLIHEQSYRQRAPFILGSVETQLGYPVIVKPDSLGSSIGISVARDEASLQSALENCFLYDRCALVEPYLSDATEVYCACYRKDGARIVSECESVGRSGEIYTYEQKYLQADAPVRRFSEIPDEISAYVKRAVKSLYKHLGASGVVRADFLLHENVAYFSELNTVPGSLAHYYFGGSLVQYSHFLTELIEEGISDFAKAQKKTALTGDLTRFIRSLK